MYKFIFTAALGACTLSAAHGSLFISEVMSSENATQTYGADWFELTNTGPVSLSISGWKIDDDSNSFGSGALLTGVASIAAGQSVVFIEGSSTTAANFINSWFGGMAPAGFTIGTYSGSGLGLGANGDQVNIFDASGLRQANVSFSTASAGRSFDNAPGLSGAISSLSTAGTNGAFTAPSGEIGSPGAIPEPSTAVSALAGLGVLALVRRRRSARA